jgi:hypothetical protein
VTVSDLAAPWVPNLQAVMQIAAWLATEAKLGSSADGRVVRSSALWTPACPDAVSVTSTTPLFGGHLTMTGRSSWRSTRRYSAARPAVEWSASSRGCISSAAERAAGLRYAVGVGTGFFASHVSPLRPDILAESLGEAPCTRTTAPRRYKHISFVGPCLISFDY